MTAQAKLKKCSECPTWFRPWKSTQRVCSGDCGLARVRRLDDQKKRAAERKRAKAERAELRRRKEAIKTKREWEKDAQKAFNAYIRERDHGKPCISCGRNPSDRDLLTGSRFDAGHYRSVGAMPALRFEPLNVHRQCVQCNRDHSGNVVEYRLRLKERIGEANLEWLEGPHPPARYTKEQLKEITRYYRAETRRLKRERHKREELTPC